MRAHVGEIIREALAKAAEGLKVAGTETPEVIVEVSKKEEFGDYSTNLAMLLAPVARRAPRDIAAILQDKIAENPLVEKCEVAGPGFINIFLKKSFWASVLAEILDTGERYGKSRIGAGERVQVEFVSANPTGPLHIGHGRGAAVGDSLANILKAAGYAVTKEFYINDVGRQIETLGRSVLVRYRQALGDSVELPEDSYKGEYIKDVAQAFINLNGEDFLDMPEEEALPVFKDFAKDYLLDRIKEDLRDFSVKFDIWYSEKFVHDKGMVDDTIEALENLGHIYEKDGAVWFRTTDFGDDKDRVLVKADGSRTYFASDVAYHREKIERGFTTIVDVWGADHHGYEARIRALIKALGYNSEALKVVFIQLVALLRGGVPVAMGKREGEFVTLKQVMDEVGKDACRFFFLMRRSDAHLDFDLELAKSQAPENPVYYVQYCHARIQSIFDYAAEKGFTVPPHPEPSLLALLKSRDDIELIKHLGAYPEVVERSARAMEPHRIAFYLMELAGIFHPYYNRNRVVNEDEPETTLARLLICKAVKTVAANGLGLLGVDAPSKM